MSNSERKGVLTREYWCREMTAEEILHWTFGTIFGFIGLMFLGLIALVIFLANSYVEPPPQPIRPACVQGTILVPCP